MDQQPPVIIIRALRRRSDLSVPDFRRHWHEVHGPLLAATSSYARHVSHYLQCPRTDWDYDERPDVLYDGFVLLEFPSHDAWRAASEDVHGLAALRADERAFLDGENSPKIICTAPHRLIAPRPSADPVRLMALVARQAGTTPAFFRDYWLKSSVPIFLGLPDLTARFSRYEQYHRAEFCYKSRPDVAFDGFAIEVFTSPATFREHPFCPLYLQALAPYTPVFMNKAANIRLMVDEPIVVIERGLDPPVTAADPVA